MGFVKIGAVEVIIHLMASMKCCHVSSFFLKFIARDFDIKLLLDSAYRDG
jgi:hypothetical protein